MARQKRMQQRTTKGREHVSLEEREARRRETREAAQQAFEKHEEAVLPRSNFERIYPENDPALAEVYDRVLRSSCDSFDRDTGVFAAGRRRAGEKTSKALSKDYSRKMLQEQPNIKRR